jgi:hypothetical protein
MPEKGNGKEERGNRIPWINNNILKNKKDLLIF